MDKKILIVEDEKAMSDTLSIKLQSEGFKTTIANDGAKALAILQLKTFDLIILDLMMPKVDGFQLLAEMKNKNIKTPVFVASNLDQNEDIEKALKLGAIDHFIKSSISLTEIVDKIKRILD